MPATKKLTASRLPRLACEGAGPTVPDDAVVTVIFPEPVPQRSARQYRSSQREGFDAWRPPARFIRGKYSKQAMRRNGAKHIIRSHGLEGGGCTREPSSRCAQLPARPARLLSKIHQRTFISKTNRRTPWRKNRSRRRATFCTSTIFA